MTIKSLAVALFSAKEAQWLIPAAADMASRTGAHLTGVLPMEAQVPFAGTEGSLVSYGAAFIPEWQRQEAVAIAEAFQAAVAGRDFLSDFRQQPLGSESAENFLLENVAAADLVLAGQCPKKGSRHSNRQLQEQLIRHSGRPVLILPDGWPPAPIGTNILIGWSNTREAIRAAHYARALAQPGASISILHIGDGGLGLACREDIAAAFDRHGHAVTLIDRERTALDTGSMLVKVAVECGADMLAAGAFGHSWAYDFVIGAATRELLERSKLPVLFSK
ncbi:universal stress protein [Leisingera thetidis]|uniref:universal stress protein n=1 Tax=Leisingera thetidis TaxID=2930199 RepID=UPI0021F715A4|nr:universal stress protein [Leisingera thetidis]